MYSLTKQKPVDRGVYRFLHFQHICCCGHLMKPLDSDIHAQYNITNSKANSKAMKCQEKGRTAQDTQHDRGVNQAMQMNAEFPCLPGKCTGRLLECKWVF